MNTPTRITILPFHSRQMAFPASCASAAKVGDVRFLISTNGEPLFISAPAKNAAGDAVLYGPGIGLDGKMCEALGVWIATKAEADEVVVSKLEDVLDIRLALHILNHPELEPMTGEAQ